jgi:O-antigen biosynthesis protein
VNIDSTTPPLVSILVVTYTQHELLACCLDRLEVAARGFATETIVLVNGVPLQPEHYAAKARGAVVLHAPVNLGLAGGLHYARSHARGRYLAIVQDDVEVEQHWLTPLVSTLDCDPTVGAVGSRITLLDGEPFADGIVMPRGGVHSVVEPAARPDANWAVDACFSASCLVRADAWDSVGGANPRLYPNQQVDIDLGLRLAEGNWSVLIARESVARHLRNASTTSLQRRYLLRRNRRIVKRDHRRLLAEHPAQFLDADDVASWLARCAAVAEQRRRAPLPQRTARPPIPLDVLVRDARIDARRFRVGTAILRVRLALRYRRRALIRFLRRRRTRR